MKQIDAAKIAMLALLVAWLPVTSSAAPECKNVKKEYKKAAKLDTAAAYEAFNQKCGYSGPYGERARDRSDVLEFEEAKLAGTPESWRKYFGKTVRRKFLEEAIKLAEAKPAVKADAESLVTDIVVRNIAGHLSYTNMSSTFTRSGWFGADPDRGVEAAFLSMEVTVKWDQTGAAQVAALAYGRGSFIRQRATVLVYDGSAWWKIP